MSDIEEKLYVIHAEARETGTVTSGTRSNKDKKMEPFARVTMVTEGSPSSIAVSNKKLIMMMINDI